MILAEVAVNAKNESGSTPLHEAVGSIATTVAQERFGQAAFAGHVEVCKVLLAHGAEAVALHVTEVKHELDLFFLANIQAHVIKQPAIGSWQ